MGEREATAAFSQVAGVHWPMAQTVFSLAKGGDRDSLSSLTADKLSCYVPRMSLQCATSRDSDSVIQRERSYLVLVCPENLLLNRTFTLCFGVWTETGSVGLNPLGLYDHGLFTLSFIL